MNLWEAYDKIDEYLKEKLLTIPPYPSVSGNTVGKLLDCLEKSRSRLGRIRRGNYKDGCKPLAKGILRCGCLTSSYHSFFEA